MYFALYVPAPTGIMPSQFFGDVQYRDVKTRRLAREALRTKWAEPQKTNVDNLGTMCPFCRDAWKNNGTCTNCLAPPSMCADEGRGGLIGLYMAKHGDCLILHLPPEEFDLMRSKLVELAKEGLAAACLRAIAPPIPETMPSK